MSAYAFGDGDAAGRRLALLHALFAPSMRALVRAWCPPAPTLCLDLGCGPGHTTRELAAATSAGRCVGLDASEGFLAAARQQNGPAGVEYARHDVTQVPFPAGPADLIYARFLLTHLPAPGECIRRWATQLRPGGVLLLEETEAIRTDVPAFRTYLEIADALLAANGNILCIGPALAALECPAGLAMPHNGICRVPASAAVAAGIFRLNLPSWRRHPFIREHHLDTVERLERELSALAGSSDPAPCIEWEMRQVVLSAR